MAMSEKIAQEKHRISERLMRLDAERTKLSDQLDELEIAERALKRFLGKARTIEKRKKASSAKTAPAAAVKRGTRDGHQKPAASLSDAALSPVRTYAKGASAPEALQY